MTDTDTGDTKQIDESDRCEKCDELPEFDKTQTNPLDGVEEDRYECGCGWITVVVSK